VYVVFRSLLDRNSHVLCRVIAVRTIVFSLLEYSVLTVACPSVSQYINGSLVSPCMSCRALQPRAPLVPCSRQSADESLITTGGCCCIQQQSHHTTVLQIPPLARDLQHRQCTHCDQEQKARRLDQRQALTDGAMKATRSRL